MPLTSTLMTKRLHLSPEHKDFRLSQFCGLLACIGLALLALAPLPVVLVLGLVVLSLGSAVSVTARSLATSFVAEDQIGMLYSATAVMTSLGTVAAGPFFAYAFRLGLNFGRAWSGLPFLISAVLFSITLGAFCCIRLDRNGAEEEEE